MKTLPKFEKVFILYNTKYFFIRTYYKIIRIFIIIFFIINILNHKFYCYANLPEVEAITNDA